MLIINFNFTLILVINFLILGLFIFFISKFFKTLVRNIQQKISDITKHIYNSLQGIEVIKIFNREEQEKKYFSKLVKRYLQLIKRQILIQYLNRPINEFFITFGALIIIFYASILIWEDSLSITKMFTFFSILIFIVPYVQRFNNGFFIKQKISVAIERLFENFYKADQEEQTSGEILDEILIKKGKSYQGNLEFKQVSFGFNKGQMILKNISFKIDKGDFVAIVGESGGGKTTLISMIPLLFYPSQGEIFYDKISHHNLVPYGVRKHIAYVPQESILFPCTIKENILYGKNEATEEEIHQAAKLANIHDMIVDLPQGYDTYVGERGNNLSVGQKQRLAIARALIRNPRLLILDEATSALDGYSEKLIQESLKKISNNKTIIAITHRLSTVLNADKIMVISQGEIKGWGNHKELLSNNLIYKKLYQAQFSEKENNLDN
jgi:ABC-type multidrug transport system fused ATPase/permease subunit